MLTPRTSFVFWAALAACLSSASAQIAFGPDPDPNRNAPNSWGTTDVFNQGIYDVDDRALEPDGNDVLKATAGAVGTFNDQFGFSVHISNGENGNNGDDPADPDPMNTEPADAIWSTIGNPSGRLENGNVVRFSMWMRQDPSNPINTAPSIEPILKLEFWTQALSGNADFSLSFNPTFGDRVYDTDQNGAVPFATYVDSNNDGFRNDINVPSVSLSTAGWTLVSTEYTVNDSAWGYSPPGGTFIPKTVADIEELRPVLFTGDFAGTDLTNGGSLLVDNPMLEVYRSTGDVPGTIPNPTPATPAASLLVNRETGQMTLTNLTSSTSELVSYAITSVAGGLDGSEWLSIADNYDQDNGDFDPNNVWNVVNTTSGELSEASSSTTSGGDLTPGFTLDLGPAWQRTPFEDLTFSFTLADGTTGGGAVRFTGNGGVPFARSDLNADGTINALDWELFYPNTLADLNSLSTAEAYLRGDLDGDNDNDFQDFRIFKSDFIVVNGQSAWNALVPEPSSWTLLVAGLAALSCVRRRARPMNQRAICGQENQGLDPTDVAGTTGNHTSNRRLTWLLLLLVVLGGSWLVPSAHAQLTHYVPFDAGYVAGNDLNGSGGSDLGFGSNTWFDGAATGTGSAVVAGNLSAPDPVLSAGNHARTANSEFNLAFYTFDQNSNGMNGEPEDALQTGEHWLSFVARSDANAFFGGLSLVKFFGPEVLYIGKVGGAGGTQWGIDSGGNAIAAGGDITQDTFLVAKLTLGPGANDDTVDLFINPAFGASPPAIPDLTASFNEDPSGNRGLDEIRLGSQNGAFFADEIRIGASFADVAVPDPTFQTLTLEVDTLSGNVRLQNKSAQPFTIDYYQVSSASGALNTDGWLSLDEQNFDAANGGWNEAGGSNANQLAELFLNASGSTIGAGFDESLGTAFDPSVLGIGMDGDLQFRFGVVGGGLVTGAISYVSNAVNCDFNGDSACNIDDLNQLLAEGPIAGGVAVMPGVNEEFDLNGDNVINNADRDLWLASAASENGLDSAYLVGDSNLDGVVDVSDFNNWNSNKFNGTLRWDNGDFNGDGVADVSDFNAWNGNKFQSSSNPAVVPEPTSAMLAGLAMLCISRLGRWRREPWSRNAPVGR